MMMIMVSVCKIMKKRKPMKMNKRGSNNVILMWRNGNINKYDVI